MRARTIMLLVFAVAAAGTTFYLAQNWIAAQRGALTRTVNQNTPKPAPSVLVLVAGQELPAGQFIKPKHLRWQPWPKKGVADTYYIKGEKRRPEEAVAAKNVGQKPKGKDKDKSGQAAKAASRSGPNRGVIDDFVGAVVRSKIMAGEPITEGRVVRPGERGFLAAVLQPGMRAISVPINATTGISGFVFPGDKVDLLLTHVISKNDGAVRRATETVLSDIRVLAVDQRTDDVEGKPAIAKTATLEVTPKQAEVIAVASEMGRLSLSLRSLAKEVPTVALLRKARTYTWDTEASHLISRKTKKDGYVVKVIRGGSATAQQFAKNKTGGYVAAEGANIQPAATAVATGTAGAPKNLIGKVQP